MEDHDQRFKHLLEAFLREFMELFFAKWANRFDWARVEFLQQELFTDVPQGAHRYLDLIARIAIKPEHAIKRQDNEHLVLLVHVEVESGDNVGDFPARMFEYYALLRGRHHLPILPIGLFLRVGLDGTGWGTYGEDIWGENLVSFHYAYIGLPRLPAAEYVESDNPLGAALSILMKASTDDRARLKLEAIKRVNRAAISEPRRFLLWELIHTYGVLEGKAREEYDRLIESPEYREEKMVVNSTFERLRNEGREEGREEGRQVGREEGREEGRKVGREEGREEGRKVGREEGRIEQIELVKDLVRERFGEVPPSILRQVENLTFEQRRLLARRLLNPDMALDQLGLE